jgi:glycosyltransferase involved in cell wall biosynthesis
VPDPLRIDHLAVAIPAYNEADGIAGFLSELAGALAGEAGRVSLVVADDVSTDDTLGAVRGVCDLPSGVEIIVDEGAVNGGHGPTVVRAYRRCLDLGADVVAQVDGDGQFDAEDFAGLLAAVRAGADVATGRRVARVDPWFRVALSRLLVILGRVVFGARRADVNCPFRVYRAPVLADLLGDVDANTLVPHVLLTMLEARAGLTHVEIDVRHRVRRGEEATGTMWQGGAAVWRLAGFAGRALREVLRFRLAMRRAG